MRTYPYGLSRASWLALVGRGLTAPRLAFAYRMGPRKFGILDAENTAAGGGGSYSLVAVQRRAGGEWKCYFDGEAVDTAPSLGDLVRKQASYLSDS